MQLSEHRINAVNAKKLPENRPQRRRRYRLPKLTLNVSLQAGQERLSFHLSFCQHRPTPIFHPYFFHPFFFSPILFTKLSPILFFTHSFFNPYFLQSFHPYFFHPYFFSPMLFTKFHPYFFSPILFFTHTFFTHSFFTHTFYKVFTHTLFHPYFFTHSFYKVFKHTFVSPILFTKFLIPMFFFNHVFHSCLLQSSLENEPPCLVYFHHIIFIPHYVFTTFKA